MIIIAGAGIAGLSLAYELARRGWDVCIFEAGEIAGQTSGVATSYLEPRLGDTPLRRLERRSLALWPQWAERIEHASGISVDFQADGQLRVALEEDVAHFEKDMQARQQAGWLVEKTSPPPGLFGNGVVEAAFLPLPCRVDGQAVCRALGGALAKMGVAINTQCAVTHIEPADGSIRVTDGTGKTHKASAFVKATGMAHLSVTGLSADAPRPRPVQGINVEYALDDLPVPIAQMIKHRRGYLCPRSEGRLWVGTTYDHGVDGLVASPQSLARVIAQASAIVPALKSLKPRKVHVGLRAKCGDGLPVVGQAKDKLPVFYSMGHGGSGFLRAPATAVDLAEQIAAFLA